MNGLCQPISRAERAWREAMARAGYQIAPCSVAFHWAHLLSPGGDQAAAELAYREYLAAEPNNLSAIEGLAFLLQRAGRLDQVAALRERAAALHAQLGDTTGEPAEPLSSDAEQEVSRIPLR